MHAVGIATARRCLVF